MRGAVSQYSSHATSLVNQDSAQVKLTPTLHTTKYNSRLMRAMNGEWLCFVICKPQHISPTFTATDMCCQRLWALLLKRPNNKLIATCGCNSTEDRPVPSPTPTAQVVRLNSSWTKQCFYARILPCIPAFLTVVFVCCNTPFSIHPSDPDACYCSTTPWPNAQGWTAGNGHTLETAAAPSS